MTKAPMTKATVPGGYHGGLLGKDSPTEQSRLAAIQASTDAFTTAILGGLGLAADWKCLELGAGAGSIARWLARQCPQGRVVAVDNDVRFLDAGTSANLSVVEADITDEVFRPGEFDLVHARFVLCHLPARDQLIARAVKWLRPGGWLVVADPYQLPPDTSPFPFVRRLMTAYEAAYARHGADLTWSRTVPSLLARNGLVDIDFAGRPACMGNLGKDRWRPLITQVEPALVADPLLSRDLEEFAARLGDPAFIDIPQFTLAVWGRLPC